MGGNLLHYIGKEDYIYSTLPEKLQVNIDDETKFKILLFLKQKNDFVNISKISDELNLNKSDYSGANIRKAITELVTIHKQPIISSHRGYKYTEDRYEIEGYITNLKNRAKGILRRLSSMRKIERWL